MFKKLNKNLPYVIGGLILVFFLIKAAFSGGGELFQGNLRMESGKIIMPEFRMEISMHQLRLQENSFIKLVMEAPDAGVYVKQIKMNSKFTNLIASDFRVFRNGKDITSHLVKDSKDLLKENINAHSKNINKVFILEFEKPEKIWKDDAAGYELRAIISFLAKDSNVLSSVIDVTTLDDKGRESVWKGPEELTNLEVGYFPAKD